jgi:hypothetical protein
MALERRIAAATDDLTSLVAANAPCDEREMRNPGPKQDDPFDIAHDVS